MPEKLAIAVAGVMAVILGVLAKISLVKRSEVFTKSGETLFQRVADCKTMQEHCHITFCGKIDELKDGQIEVKKELKKISDVVIRLEERMLK